MIDILGLVYVMVFAPLLCAAILTVLKFAQKNIPNYFNFALSGCFSFFGVMASALLFQYIITYQGYTLENNYPVCVIDNILLYFGIYADNLSSIFILLANVLFFVANIFSYGYLKQKSQGFARFFIYLNFMQFFLLCFFISSNLIQSMVSMMFLSLSGYLFTNFYFQKQQAQEDAGKVFQIDISGDFILLCTTIALLYFSTLVPDSVNIPTLGYNNINSLGLYSFAGLNPYMFGTICLLFILGSCIKSALYPFSSKLHLATQVPNPVLGIFLSPVMLGAGVFLLFRLYPLLNLAPMVFEVLKVLGIATALVCALIAAKENDLKKLAVWIALSHVGISLTALGFKLHDLSVFYLLASGFGIILISYVFSAIAYCTLMQENIKFLGGLRQKLPLAAASYLVGAISLSGFVFSGFYSRSELLGALKKAGEGADFVYPVLILFCSFLCAFYLFRAYFRIFEGKYRGNAEIQKPSKLMGTCITLLNIPVIFFSFILVNRAQSYFCVWQCKNTSVEPFLNVFAFIVSALGYYLAYNIYFTKRIPSLRIKYLRGIATRYFYTDNFIDFIFNSIPRFFGKVFSFCEKYIIGFLYSIPSIFTRFASYLALKLEPVTLNSYLYKFILAMFVISITAAVIYFQAEGVLR